MYVTSVLYFKGVWEQPFYKPATSKQLFYDDSNKVIANVSMMEDIGRYAFDSILNEHAEAIEIPYVVSKVNHIFYTVGPRLSVALVRELNFPLLNINK